MDKYKLKPYIIESAFLLCACAFGGMLILLGRVKVTISWNLLTCTALLIVLFVVNTLLLKVVITGIKGVFDLVFQKKTCESVIFINQEPQRINGMFYREKPLNMHYIIKASNQGKDIILFSAEYLPLVEGKKYIIYFYLHSKVIINATEVR